VIEFDPASQVSVGNAVGWLGSNRLTLQRRAYRFPQIGDENPHSGHLEIKLTMSDRAWSDRIKGRACARWATPSPLVWLVSC
jgi:hypothetical protein